MVKVYVQFVEKEFDCMNEEELLKYRQESTRIVCAAMLMKDKTVVPGVRHFSPEMRIVLHKMYGNGYHLLVEEQGFVDQYGNFLDRDSAWIIAQKQGQIIKDCGCEGTLYSENLY